MGGTATLADIEEPDHGQSGTASLDDVEESPTVNWSGYSEPSGSTRVDWGAYAALPATGPSAKEQSDVAIARIAQGPTGAPPLGAFPNSRVATSKESGVEPLSEAEQLFASQRQASERRVGAPLALTEGRVAPFYGRDREFGNQNYTTTRGGFPSRQIQPVSCAAQCPRPD